MSIEDIAAFTKAVEASGQRLQLGQAHRAAVMLEPGAGGGKTWLLAQLALHDRDFEEAYRKAKYELKDRR